MTNDENSRSFLQKEKKNDHETSDSAHGVQKSDTPFLYFTMITVIIPLVINCSINVWTSPALIKLLSNNTSENVLERPITTGEISLLLGIPGIGGLIGTSLLPKLADFMGKKKFLQLISIGMLTSSIGSAFSTDIKVLIFFNFLLRTFSMSTVGIVPPYVTEICENHNRSKYGCFMMISIPIGHLYVLLIGPAFGFKYFTLLMAAPMILFIILFSFAPESPVYSLSKGRTTECVKTIRKLRSNKSEKKLEIDLSNIKRSLITKNEHKFSLSKVFGTKEGRIGLFLSTLPLVVQSLCGVQVITPLMAPIFNESGSNLSGNTIAIIVAGIKLISFSFIIYIVERSGRKPLLLLSSIGTGTSLLFLGIYFYLKQVNYAIPKQLQWVPLVCISGYAVSYSLGLGPVPMGMMAELFTPDIRSTGVAIALTIGTIIIPACAALYPIIAEMFGTHWCMWFFGFWCFTGAFLFYVMVPETRGKSTVEINKLLKNYTFFLCKR